MSANTLPWDIRYTLRYTPTEFSVKDVKILASTGFDSYALYAALKGLHQDYNRQFELLDELIQQIGDSKKELSMAQILEKHLDKLPWEFKVDARKIAQINRYGIEFFESSVYNWGIEMLLNEKTPVVTAYSATIGLISMIKALNSQKEGKVISILPKHFSDDNPVGFLIEYNKKFNLKPLYRASEKNYFTNPVIFDETIVTGDTIKQVLLFFEKHDWPNVTEAWYFSNVNGLTKIKEVPLFLIYKR